MVSVLKPGTPAWFAAATAKTKVFAYNVSHHALLAEETTRIIANKYHLNRDQVVFALPTVDIRNTELGRACPLQVDSPCQPSKYRALSGYCNNVVHPTWGNANTHYVRFLPPDYLDGISIPRQSVTTESLPSAREVSLTVHKDVERLHSHLTTVMAVFGELIFHDIAHTAQTAGFQGHRIKCCGVSRKNFHPECLPVATSQDDPTFGPYRQFCMEYIRSCTSPRVGCTLGPREQTNQVTAFLDGSSIYGSSLEESSLLRESYGGLLQTQISQSGKELLPPEYQMTDCRAGRRVKCFLAGDVRVNENAGLMVIHTIWMREHNRIARVLSELNPHWQNDELFEEARRIVVAEFQHVTYNELLLELLGEEVMNLYDLKPQTTGYYSRYDINSNPGVSNVVASAVLGFLYSMMPSQFDLYSKETQKVGFKPMSQTFFNPEDMYKFNGMTELMMGLVTQRSQAVDEFITGEMTNSSFFDSKSGEGIDMAAMIIQQGRDHGVPGYTSWRKFCHLLPSIKSFRDLHLIMLPETVNRMVHLYKNVDDIDIFTGGLAEIPLEGTVVGPTFSCLLGIQFQQLKRGDRFWYENDIPPSSFNKEQLKEIRKVSLARILCDNADTDVFLQPSIMLVVNPFLNAQQTCDSETIPRMDLTRWRTDTPSMSISEEILEASINRAFHEAAELQQTEMRTVLTNEIGVAKERSPEAIHLGFLRPKIQAQIISNHSLVLELASQGFVTTMLNRQPTKRSTRDIMQDLMTALPNIDLKKFIDPPEEIGCNDDGFQCAASSKFRTFSGHCNNIENPTLGKSMTTFDRLLPPHYQDDMSAARILSVNGQPLPSPRVISTTVHYDISTPHIQNSLLLMQFAQFVDHDLTFTPMNQGPLGSALNCKNCESGLVVHPECFPIRIPKNDPFYPVVDLNTGQANCISFVRSLPGQLKLGRREQMNQVTAYVDLSQVYGSDKCDAQKLRAFNGGRLKSTHHPVGGKELLPQTSARSECSRASSGICFKAGDTRASEQPGLTVLHTVFLREHNRIVGNLQRINQHWSDEDLYNNGRRILSAVMQHVIYSEFLPRILGWEMVTKFKLKLKSEGYYKSYNPSCKPGIYNEFSTAAFRFGHSLIKPVFQRMERKYQTLKTPFQLRNGFFNSDVLFQRNFLDQMMRGLVATSMETLDNTITQEVTNHLFEDSLTPFSGMDLAALNLQRGRDHGLQPYNSYREICNLTKARQFEDLANEMPGNIIENLRQVYDFLDIKNKEVD
ncbi:thyroid peroxidase-like [Limulus polyphemus]|uniref:Thyroid peroxidase-like n=1 Tax=Limulus polyphemus TaxID=6850 RepID=A0ABM1S8U8_LIMPO|nr:thyroid peroxidase-like [Limulus polyphemus]